MENPDRPARDGRRRGIKLNLTQKFAVCATLIVEAVFLFAGGCQVRMWQLKFYDHQVIRSANPPPYAFPAGACMDWGRTIAVAIGILLAGGVATFLLGLISRRAWRSIVSSLSH